MAVCLVININGPNMAPNYSVKLLLIWVIHVLRECVILDFINEARVGKDDISELAHDLNC